MKKNTSALTFVDGDIYGDEFSTVFDAYGGELIETELNEKDVKEIRQVQREVENV